MKGLEWRPAASVTDVPHVMVDGGAGPATVLCLSHWPGSPTPQAVRADLSAQIVFAWLDRRRRWSRVPAKIVATDHVDQDGLVSAWTLVDPAAAEPWRARLVSVAAAGDFAVCSDRDAARVSFALATLADPERSPLGPSLFGSGSAGEVGGDTSGDPVPPVPDRDPDAREAVRTVEAEAALTAELLGRLPELLAHPERQPDLWEAEDASLTAGLSDLAAGRIAVEEAPGLDLAVIRTTGRRPSLATRFCRQDPALVHPLVLGKATAASRLLVTDGTRTELSYRYESWVRFTSRRLLPRVELLGLASRLTDEEGGGTVWTFPGVAALVPRLAPGGDGGTDLPFDRIRTLVQDWLATAPPAWGPEGPVARTA